MTWPDYMPRATSALADGSERHIGYEVEFSGLDLEDAADRIAEVLGSPARRQTEYELTIVTELGVFRVERDVTWLKALGQRRARGQFIGAVDRVKQSLVGPVAESLMPLELISPPLTYAQLGQIDEIAWALHQAGAVGTAGQLYYAFGVHINIEVWSTDAADLTRALRAFAILQHYLVQLLDVDLARRVTPYITPYPDDYVQRLVARNYRPTQAELIDDYIRYNPTRGRALDLLVVLAHIDEPRVRALLPDEEINPRPAFHFRLPNSGIGQPGWQPSALLRTWALVEHLASDEELLVEASRCMATRLGSHRLATARPEASDPWLMELVRRIVPRPASHDDRASLCP